MHINWYEALVRILNIISILRYTIIIKALISYWNKFLVLNLDKDIKRHKYRIYITRRETEEVDVKLFFTDDNQSTF